jgi:transposase-like protein
MVERGGRVRVRVVPNRHATTLQPILTENVSPDATLYTDELGLYVSLGRDFASHRSIKHQDGVYAEGDIHTQTIEGIFGTVKRGLSGVQPNVSRRWLESYVREFAFKYNHRHDKAPMFKIMLERVGSA